MCTGYCQRERHDDQLFVRNAGNENDVMINCLYVRLVMARRDEQLFVCNTGNGNVVMIS